MVMSLVVSYLLTVVKREQRTMRVASVWREKKGETKERSLR
jgi:hypothetical protein